VDEGDGGVGMTAYMKAGAILLLVALGVGALFGAYHHCLSVKDRL